MSEVIVITSGKGGVGKTTTTANIGTGLAQLNKKVVMIDTDIGLRNLDVVMGLENRIVYNLVDVVEGKCRIRQALIKDKRYPELCLLPSAQTRDKDAVTPEQTIDDQVNFLHFIGFQKSYNTVCITDGRYFRCRNNQCTIRTCYRILKSLLDTGRAVQ